MQLIRQRLTVSILLAVSASGFAVVATELRPLSSTELHSACLAYQRSQDSVDGRCCSAYIRGFFEGSSDVVAGMPPDSGRGSFKERAIRTRLGRQALASPTYCIDSATSLQAFIGQLLEYAKLSPPRDDVEARVLLVGTLDRFHRCAD